jgi:hypothetical protein
MRQPQKQNDDDNETKFQKKKSIIEDVQRKRKIEQDLQKNENPRRYQIQA